MTDTYDPMEVIAQAMANNDRDRADRANTAWRAMTPHERRLYREAAVMGYVLGLRAKSGPDPDPHPRDSAVTANVIEHCDSDNDLYPYTAALCNGTRRRITRTRLWPGEKTS